MSKLSFFVGKGGGGRKGGQPGGLKMRPMSLSPSQHLMAAELWSTFLFAPLFGGRW